MLSVLEPTIREKLFCFEEMWLSNLGCEEVVHSAWNNGDGTNLEGEILAKVDKFGKDLNWWSKNVFGNVRKELERLKKCYLRPKLKPCLVVTIFGLDSLRRRLMCYWKGNLLCGLNGHDCYRLSRAIGIPNISTTVLQRDIEKFN